jgi:hypothetical protein
MLMMSLMVLASVTAVPAADSRLDDVPVVVPIGAGNYASRPPRSQSSRPGVPGKAGAGDHGAIPSTDWPNNLLTKDWGRAVGMRALWPIIQVAG